MNRPRSVSLGTEHYKIHFYKSDALPVTKLTASITKKWNLKTIDKNQMTHYLLQMTSRTGSLPISTRSQAGDTRSVVPRQSTRSACFACSSAVDRTRFSRLSPKLMMVFDKYPSHPYNIIMRHSRYKSVLIDTTNSNQWNRHHQQTNTQFFLQARCPFWHPNNSVTALLVGRQEGHLACKKTGCWWTNENPYL